MLSRKKKLAFSLLPTLLLAGLLVAAEIVLRTFYPAREEGLVSEAQYDGIEWFQINRSHLKKYFPPGFPTIPEFKSSLFRKKKEPNTFRVMCLGESSMFGTPYDMNANIPGILRAQLRSLYPQKEIEVVNWGASAINSNVILDLLDPILALEPDVIVIYMGHNEFYGPDGVGASALERAWPTLIQYKYQLKDLRLVQAFQSFFPAAQPSPGAEMNLMRQVSGEHLVPLESPAAQRVIALYESNLTTILHRIHAQGVPVIVSDVGSNLMFPPFVPDSLSNVGSSAEAFAAVRSLFHAGKLDSVLTRLRAFLPQDSVNAFVNYWWGRTLLQQGKAAEALPYLERARDEDLLKFRAPGSINAVIRRVCMEHGTTLVSAESLLAAESPEGVAGDDMFWEHLHPTARGYYLIANLFTRKILELNLVSSDGLVRGLLPLNPDSLGVCWLELAYADLSIQHLTGRWPFTDFRRATVVLQDADEALRTIALDTYARRIGWDEACYRSAIHFWETRRYSEARTTYEALIQDYPYGFYPHYLLGSLLNQMGESDGACLHLAISVRSNPSYPNAHLDLGLIAVNKGEFDEGIKELKSVVDLSRGQERSGLRANAFYGLAAAYANKGELDQALSFVDEALRINPTYEDAVNLKETIRRSRGR